MREYDRPTSEVAGANSPLSDGERPESVTDDTVNLLDLLIVLMKHKVLIVGMTAGAALLSVVYALSLPNIYTATAKVLPPQQPHSMTAASMLGQFSGLAGAVGTPLGIKNPADVYVGMLKSRTVGDGVIKRFDLQRYYGSDTMVSTRNTLAANSTIATGKDGLITVEFNDSDPVRAAAIANAYVEELDRITQSLAITQAAQRRLFFERQLARAKSDLVNAELAARDALERGGIVTVDEHGKSIIESVSRVRAEITVKEIQVGAMQGFATAQNPDLLRTHQELAALRTQLAKLEGAERRDVTVTKRGAEGLRNIGLLRNVRYNEVLFELLAKQYELARIEEAKDAAVIQVLDAAVAPDRKSKPARAPIVIAVTLGSAFAAVVLAFLLEIIERTRHDPRQSTRVAALRRYAWFRR